MQGKIPHNRVACCSAMCWGNHVARQSIGKAGNLPTRTSALASLAAPVAALEAGAPAAAVPSCNAAARGAEHWTYTLHKRVQCTTAGCSGGGRGQACENGRTCCIERRCSCTMFDLAAQRARKCWLQSSCVPAAAYVKCPACHTLPRGDAMHMRCTNTICAYPQAPLLAQLRLQPLLLQMERRYKLH